MKKYINKWSHTIWLGLNKFLFERQIKQKLIKLIWYILNVIFTGIVLHYILNNNNWLALGLLAAVSQYYVGWLIDKIKEKRR